MNCNDLGCLYKEIQYSCSMTNYLQNSFQWERPTSQNHSTCPGHRLSWLMSPWGSSYQLYRCHLLAWMLLRQLHSSNLKSIPAICSPGSEVIKLFSCSTQRSMKFFLLINVKMPTIVGILTFMSRKNSILGWSEPGKSWISRYFFTYEHLKFHAQLSWAWKKFYNLGASFQSSR